MEKNSAQEKAIRHKEGPMMLLAGPGSGKTFTMTRRVEALLGQHHVNPANILVVTFTKAAAREMKERFERLCESSGIGANYKQVTFGTFHGIFYGILRHAYGLSGKNIISEERKMDILREIVYRQRVQIEDEKELFEGLVQEISEVKNDRIPLEHYYSKNCPDEVFRAIYTSYITSCRQARLLDFDDMLLYCYDLLDKRPDILAGWQKKFQYILVDEFQDINKIQYDIVEMLAAPQNNLFIVGDDDQSIYAFRGAKPEIMMHFPKDFPTVRTELLPCNYRSTKEIVEAAGRVIACNQRRFKKKIHTDNEEGIPPVIMGFDTGREEELYVKDCIMKAKKEGCPYEEMAVLYRTNSGAGFLVETLMEYQIPFQMRDNLPNIYEHWIAKDMISYMKLAMGDRSRQEFLKVMNRPNRYISREALDDAKVSFEGLRWFYEEKEWMCDRIDKMEEDLNILKNMTPYGAVNYIRHGIGYEEYLKTYALCRKLKMEDFYEVLEELADSTKGYKTFGEWFIHIEEYTEKLKEQAKKQVCEKNGVVISTLHSIKGLEFDRVFLMDVNEGTIPYHKAAADSDVEEERRLFYVGMTRARKELYMFYVKERHEKALEPSRFLIESGLKRMEKMNQPEIRIYAGKIKEWTKDLLDNSKKAESICGRRLLAYGLMDTGRKDIFTESCRADEVYDFLEKQIEKEVHGKPYFRGFSGVHFNISHSGEYAACALSSVPCGLDIQEIRPVRTKRLLERVLSEEEQQKIAEAENREWEFCKYWAMKESFLKLTGEGITRSMKDIPEPAWHEVFEMQGQIAGCISAEETCQVLYREVQVEEFFRFFRDCGTGFAVK